MENTINWFYANQETWYTNWQLAKDSTDVFGKKIYCAPDNNGTIYNYWDWSDPSRPIPIVGSLTPALNKTQAGRWDEIILAPWFYLLDTQILLNKSDVTISWVLNSYEQTMLFLSGSSSTVSASSDHLIKVADTTQNVMIRNLWLFTYKNDKAAIYIDATTWSVASGFGVTIDNCAFSPQAVDWQAYGIVADGNWGMIVRNCLFEWTKTAAIYITAGWDNPSRAIIENNIFIGTNYGINMDSAGYQLIEKDNVYIAGSESGYNLSKAINATSGFSAWDITSINLRTTLADASATYANAWAGTMTYINPAYWTAV